MTTSKLCLNMIGQRFGRLTVTRPDAGRTPKRMLLCEVRCECGTSKIVQANLLRSAKIKSCGCLRRSILAVAGKRNATHGATRAGARPTEWSIWSGMRQRCRNPNSAAYARYGGRGVKVCAAWDSFEQFLRDMGPRPGPELSLDRIDPDGDYEPTNCRWATRMQQRHNRSRRLPSHA